MKIPTTVITGFLGAGKTTLIRDLLESAGGKRIALVINEFGDLPIDGEILKGCGLPNCEEEDIVELANGCICCTVAEDFLPTMQKLLQRDPRPEHIVIETSGLALPQPLVRAFKWPEVRTQIALDGVVSVLDGLALSRDELVTDAEAVGAQRSSDPNLDHESSLEELLHAQLDAADLVVMTKTDLLDPAALERARTALQARSEHGVRVLESGGVKLTAAVLLGTGIDPEASVMRADRHMEEHHDHDHDDDEDHHDHDHDHDAFASHVLDIDEQTDPDRLTAMVRKAMGTTGVYRVKGVASIAGRDMRLVLQGVGDRVQTYYDRDWVPGEERRSRLVFIGPSTVATDDIRIALGT